MNKRNHDLPDELLSSLLANYKKPKDLIGESGLLMELSDATKVTLWKPFIAPSFKALREEN